MLLFTSVISSWKGHSTLIMLIFESRITNNKCCQLKLKGDDSLSLNWYPLGFVRDFAENKGGKLNTKRTLKRASLSFSLSYRTKCKQILLKLFKKRLRWEWNLVRIFKKVQILEESWSVKSISILSWNLHTHKEEGVEPALLPYSDNSTNCLGKPRCSP